MHPYKIYTWQNLRMPQNILTRRAVSGTQEAGAKNQKNIFARLQFFTIFAGFQTAHINLKFEFDS